MTMTLRQHLEEKHNSILKSVQELRDVAEILGPLIDRCDQQMESYYYFTFTSPPSVHLKFPASPPEAASEFVRAALSVLGIRKASKAFDEDTGLVTWKIRSPRVDFIIESAAVACKVRKIEEEVHVPARVEKRTRYEVENPEDCAKVLRGQVRRVIGNKIAGLLDDTLK